MKKLKSYLKKQKINFRSINKKMIMINFIDVNYELEQFINNNKFKKCYLGDTIAIEL